MPNPSDQQGLPSRRSEEHTSELQSQSNLVCRLLLEKKNIDEVKDQRFMADRTVHTKLCKLSPNDLASRIRCADYALAADAMSVVTFIRHVPRVVVL